LTREIEPPLTSSQVMKALGISRKTFFNLVANYPHEFVTYMSGRTRVMDREDLERWKAYRKQIDMHPNGKANQDIHKEEA